MSCYVNLLGVDALIYCGEQRAVLLGTLNNARTLLQFITVLLKSILQVYFFEYIIF